MHSDRCATVHAHLATGSHPDCAQFRFVQSGLQVLLVQHVLEGLHIQHVQLEQVLVLHAMEPPTALLKKSFYPDRLVKVEVKSQEAGACAGPTSAGAGAALAATAAAREPPCLGCPSPPF